CGGSAWPPTGAKHERKERYRQAKATKCGGMGGRESERPTVPKKPGNLAHLTVDAYAAAVRFDDPLCNRQPESRTKRVAVRHDRTAQTGRPAGRPGYPAPGRRR